MLNENKIKKYIIGIHFGSFTFREATMAKF